MQALGSEHIGKALQDLGWVFRYDRARQRLGLCRWSTRGKVISLSKAISAREGWLLMEDVARHEIAHALDFETRGRSGHDRVWKAWALRCGADPTRVYSGELTADDSSRYLGRCLADGCAYSRPFYRSVTAAYICPKCDKVRPRSYLRIEDRRTGQIVRNGGASHGSLVTAGTSKYIGRCPKCAETRPFHRRPTRRYACGECCNRHAGGRFDARFELALQQLR
jgi:predicted SprT family Zn-dependent metalloprotease